MKGLRETVHLWGMGSGLPLESVGDLLENVFSPTLACRSRGWLVPPDRTAEMARHLQVLRVTDPGRMGLGERPRTAGERERIGGILEGNAPFEDRRSFMFEGLGTMGLAASALGRAAFRRGTINIVFTAATPCTWDPIDCRYHARSVLCGFPSMISTSGAVEGPARPRGYYVAKMMGLTEAEARRKYLGRFLEHDDPRMPEVATGLAAQAIFYHLTGNPFCERENCRLFNARWQEQLVASQVKSRGLCESHHRLIKSLKRKKSRD